MLDHPEELPRKFHFFRGSGKFWVRMSNVDHCLEYGLGD